MRRAAAGTRGLGIEDRGLNSILTMPGPSALCSWTSLSPFILPAGKLGKGEASPPLGRGMGGGGAYFFSRTNDDQQVICQIRNIKCLL